MAAPLKDGLDYYPLDVDFMDDDKVIDILDKENCGARALMVLMYLWNKCYGDKGYYLVVDDKTYKRIRQYFDYTGEISEDYIKQVISECVKGGLFDESVFIRFGILTSARIQKQYLRGAAGRKKIEIIKEYLLLNIDDSNDVPEGVLGKLAIKSINEGNNRVNRPRNSINRSDNPQSKVKEKEKEIESKVDVVRQTYGIYRNVLLSETELERVKQECGSHWKDYIDRLSTYMNDSGKTYISNGQPQHAQKIIQFYKGDVKDGKIREQSYDLNKVRSQETAPIVYKRKAK